MFSFLRRSGPRPEPITPTEAVARAGAGTLRLIDVREIGELKSSGKAKGALHIPLGTIEARLNPQAGLPEGITRDTPLCLYCAAGGRSASAAATLLRLGFTQVYNLGGLGQWQAGGGEIEKV
ncbi:MAG: sulfurtransferase [Gemmobacter sp.]|jgi:rhodanese-related sulfurtransferase|nr:sulfurtransferase [Gemmobacter sp.]